MSGGLSKMTGFTYASYEALLYEYFKMEYGKESFTKLLLCSGLEQGNYYVVEKPHKSQTSDYRSGKKPVSSNVCYYYYDIGCIERAAVYFEQKMARSIALQKQGEMRAGLAMLIESDAGMPDASKDELMGTVGNESVYVFLAILLQYVLTKTGGCNGNASNTGNDKRTAGPDGHAIEADTPADCSREVQPDYMRVEAAGAGAGQAAGRPLEKASDKGSAGIPHIFHTVSLALNLLLLAAVLILSFFLFQAFRRINDGPVVEPEENAGEEIMVDDEYGDVDDEVQDDVEIDDIIEENEKPAIEVPLYSRPVSDIGDSACYNVFFDSTSSAIKIYSTYRTTLSDGSTGFHNYITYELGGLATRFTAVLYPPVYPAQSPVLKYLVLCDGELVFETTLEHDASPEVVDIDMTGAEEMTIAVELFGRVHSSISLPTYGGIRDAVVVTTGY